MRLPFLPAPYPSNAREEPSFYAVSDNPGLTPPKTSPVPFDGTTSPELSRVEQPYAIGTDWSLQAGKPPMRIARLYPNREPKGIRFSNSDKAMGTPTTGDTVYLPLPTIPKTTAIPSRVRAGYPQFANDANIPATYVGGDSGASLNPA